ncbi:recombinase family protein [Nocardia tengchongensis]|uniref:Recombinase family protein n=1 Tax=Nocardia tengchongensis TaxID=2055889 RepID=A0ABX8CI72_9NOCA|nr:recombinase family protein [Nocardia tengchongensis]
MPGYSEVGHGYCNARTAWAVRKTVDLKHPGHVGAVWSGVPGHLNRPCVDKTCRKVLVSNKSCRPFLVQPPVWPPRHAISTTDQLLDRQLRALTAAGCQKMFADKKSGKNAEREELQRCLEYLRPGDTLVVPALDRLSRSMQDLLAIVAELRRRGIGFQSLHEALDTTTPGGRLVFHVFAALAEFIRELIVEGTNEGLAAARARGQRLGRPPAMTEEQVRQARALLTRPDETVSSIARLLGVSRSTIYKYVPEINSAAS